MCRDGRIEKSERDPRNSRNENEPLTWIPNTRIRTDCTYELPIYTVVQNCGNNSDYLQVVVIVSISLFIP